MADGDNLTVQFHPFALGSSSLWLQLLREQSVDPKYRHRVRQALRISLSLLPLYLYERVRYNFLQTLPIHAPIFIVGHWRSGTTHLHNIISADPELGYVTQFQTLAPGASIVGQYSIKPRIAAMMPPTRMIDNMALTVDSPQEEELAIAASSPYSPYYLWCFPRKARQFVERYGLFQNVSPQVTRQWWAIYMDILRKAAFLAGGRRLVLKNPANTGRVAMLLNHFPDAYIIHIHRNPYDVFRSTQSLHRSSLPMLQLQDISAEELEANIYYTYTVMMRKLLADRASIPAKRFIEVRFEDLEARPMEEIRRIYAHLDLPWSQRQEKAIGTYIASQATYQKNRHPENPALVAKVNRYWQFAFEAWGYEMRSA